MLRKIWLIVFLGIILAMFFGNEAPAAVCKLRSVTGACLVWSAGSIECGIVATGVGNVLNEPVYLGCEASATIDKQWVVGCGNPGKKTLMSPGVNTVYFDGGLQGVLQLLPTQIDKNGRATVSVFAEPDPAMLAAIEAANPSICPNPNWSVIDAVPCDMQLRDVQLDANNCITADAYFDCYLPDCSTLGIDSQTKTFERRQYTCNQTSTNTYKSPICPPY